MTALVENRCKQREKHYIKRQADFFLCESTLMISETQCKVPYKKKVEDAHDLHHSHDCYLITIYIIGIVTIGRIIMW